MLGDTISRSRLTADMQVKEKPCRVR